MTSAITSFTPSDLASYSDVRQFLNGEEQAEYIIERVKDPELSKEKPLYSYWDVTKQLLTLPFYYEPMCGVAFYSIAMVSQVFGFTEIAEGAKSLSRKCCPLIALEYVVAKISNFALEIVGAKEWSEKAANLEKWSLTTLMHNLRDWTQLFKHIIYGTSYLASSRNGHREDSYPFYTQSQIPFKELGEVADKIPLDKEDGFEFYNPRGICMGMSFWFIQLYLKTKKKIDCTARAHIRAITQLFSKGTGPHETILQNCKNSDGTLFGFKSPWITPSIGKFAYVVSSEAWNKGDFQDLRSMAKNTPYFIYMSMDRSAHAGVCIKTSKTSGFIFDPNHGSLEFSGKDWMQQALSFLFSQFIGKTINSVSFIPYSLNQE